MARVRLNKECWGNWNTAQFNTHFMWYSYIVHQKDNIKRKEVLKPSAEFTHIYESLGDFFFN